MIKLEKGAKPAVLVEHFDAWTQALLSKIAAGETPTNTEKTRYRHVEIKKALIRETSGKCAYCESKLLHIHHGDVEHIYPKSLAPEKSFQWENLTLACEICNQHKSDRDPYVENIIDPYRIDPEEHLKFLGALVYPLGSARGASTRAILDLNRAELCERRKEHLDRVMGIYDTLLRNDIPIAAKKAIYENLLAKEGSNSAQYTAMTKAVIAHMKDCLPPELIN